MQRQRHPMPIIVCFVRKKTLSHPSVEGWLSQTMHLLWKLFWGSLFINHIMWQVCVLCDHDGVIATKHRAIVDIDFIYRFVYCQEVYLTRPGLWILTPLIMIFDSLLRWITLQILVSFPISTWFRKKSVINIAIWWTKDRSSMVYWTINRDITQMNDPNTRNKTGIYNDGIFSVQVPLLTDIYSWHFGTPAATVTCMVVAMIRSFKHELYLSVALLSLPTWGVWEQLMYVILKIWLTMSCSTYWTTNTKLGIIHEKKGWSIFYYFAGGNDISNVALSKILCNEW